MNIRTSCSSIYTGRMLMALGAAIALGTGCANRQQAETPPTVIQTAPAPPVAQPPATVATTTPTPVTTVPTNNTNAGPGGATGSALGDAVTRQIHTNAQMTGSRVTAVSTAEGTVRLTGMAQNRQQKALAERVARDQPGVLHVVDKIEIVPTGGIKAAAAPKVIEKKYFYIHDQAPASQPNNSSGNSNTQPNSDGDSTNPTPRSSNAGSAGSSAFPVSPGTGSGD